MKLRRRSAEPVDVLVVCTGNLCRSPVIATLLAAAVPSLTVRSAGTGAPDGEPWHPLAVQVLAEVGHDVSGRARRLRAADVASATLVLTAEGMHRGLVVGLDAGAEDRCFTVIEAARLLQLAPAPAGLGPAGLAEHLATALHDHPLEHDDDLPDPLLGTIDDFRACRERVAQALDGLVPALHEPVRL
jgi:protein-tyrosine phosphatase